MTRLLIYFFTETLLHKNRIPKNKIILGDFSLLKKNSKKIVF